MDKFLGWIKLYRKLLDNIVFRDPKLFKVFIYCLLRASHAGGYQYYFKGKRKKLKKGQFITGKIVGSSHCNMSPSTYRSKLKKLEALSIIKIESDNQKTIVTVINWYKYQRQDKK